MEILKLLSIQIFYTVKGFKYYMIDELALKFNKFLRFLINFKCFKKECYKRKHKITI